MSARKGWEGKEEKEREESTDFHIRSEDRLVNNGLTHIAVRKYLYLMSIFGKFSGH